MTPEQAEVAVVFGDMLRAATADGGRKRAKGTKPNWKVDPSHEEALFSHLGKWKKGELVDPDSGAHPLVHLAWRALAIAWQETHPGEGVVGGQVRPAETIVECSSMPSGTYVCSEGILRKISDHEKGCSCNHLAVDPDCPYHSTPKKDPLPPPMGGNGGLPGSHPSFCTYPTCVVNQKCSRNCPGGPPCNCGSGYPCQRHTTPGY